MTKQTKRGQYHSKLKNTKFKKYNILKPLQRCHALLMDWRMKTEVINVPFFKNKFVFLKKMSLYSTCYRLHICLIGV
ncbi:hypothetical protein M153_2350008151 [Pseudoloma neurophilia]|uniref:Uncharacterized protein n=1 Tax=Pseudoloma neurophilia TaxID=146866 RepID=A0A0R0M6E7_9MICR|nr:hypothetical protein M153_2350008151 [Pseudoloma neurophilia]